MTGQGPVERAHGRGERGRGDDGILLDAHDDEWEWRRRIRANPATARLYRLVIALGGLVIVVAGLALVPLPGPGWLVVFAGLALWASEFEWAQRVLDWVKARVHAWNTWVRARPWWVQGIAMLGTVVVVLALIVIVLRLSGIPSFLPDGPETYLRRLLTAGGIDQQGL
ncbi:MAG: TIGR02611 family protein [Tetrasphaera sp.]|nr:TIGR02611 family protein [Tetrasphaera sp.]